MAWFNQVVACGLADVKAGYMEKAAGEAITVEEVIPPLVELEEEAIAMEEWTKNRCLMLRRLYSCSRCRRSGVNHHPDILQKTHWENCSRVSERFAATLTFLVALIRL